MSSAAKPMIAFADPVFSKQAHVQATQQLAMRSITSFYSGTQIDVARLGEYLPQLPGTRAEVQAIGKTLKVDPSDLKLGLNATVTAVKQAQLDQYRIVYFATHGLVSGELERFAKSASSRTRVGGSSANCDYLTAVDVVRCGHVDNALALSKRSGMSTAMLRVRVVEFSTRRCFAHN